MADAKELSSEDGTKAVQEVERYLAARKKYGWAQKPMERGINLKDTLSGKVNSEKILKGLLEIGLNNVFSFTAWRMLEEENESTQS